VSILGTGVNPGFLMDTWPLFMSTLCAGVRAVRVTRIQDASTRRIPFQRKIGAGLSPEEFAAAVAGGGFGHVGLEESAALLAAGLGWELDGISVSLEPVLLDHEVRSAYATVPVGTVAGLKQVAIGSRDGRPALELEFQAYVGAPRSYDSVSLTGTPNLEVTIPGGTPGDTATAAIVVNSAAAVAAAAPGLYAMKDLPVVGCRP
jgi:4-hydroxy-tetrahydrodipicolinate reductase